MDLDDLLGLFVNFLGLTLLTCLILLASAGTGYVVRLLVKLTINL